MRRRTTALRTPATALLFAAVLAACGGKGDEPAAGAASADPSLPQPQAAGGSITDMPAQPGPGDVPLAELIARFEEGNKLLQVCETRLKDAEMKIELLKKQNGAAAFASFAPEKGEA